MYAMRSINRGLMTSSETVAPFESGIGTWLQQGEALGFPGHSCILTRAYSHKVKRAGPALRERPTVHKSLRILEVRARRDNSSSAVRAASLRDASSRQVVLQADKARYTSPQQGRKIGSSLSGGLARVRSCEAEVSQDNRRKRRTSERFELVRQWRRKGGPGELLALCLK